MLKLICPKCRSANVKPLYSVGVNSKSAGMTGICLNCGFKGFMKQSGKLPILQAKKQ